MIRYPYLQEQPSSRVTTDVFRGLNLGSRIGEGEFSEMENLTSDHFPVLAPREARGKISETTNPQAMYYVPGKGTFLIDNGKLVFIDSDGRRFEEENDKGSFCEYPTHQFALMGTRLVIAPEMKWLDIRYPFEGVKSMSAHLEIAEGSVTFSLCKRDGNAFGTMTTGAEPAESPANAELWLDPSNSELKQYSASAKEWVSVSTYLKISGLTDHPFQTGDAVCLQGVEYHAPRDIYAMENATHLVEMAGSDYIVIAGITDESYTQNCVDFPLKLGRNVPQLDFIIEAGNRLWGCIRNVNEIYASKLGDITNWNVFSGISTDSWVGNVGSSGSFTGAVNHGGYPVFYKKHMKHKVWPSSTGAHQITSTPCTGVLNSCENSVAVYRNCVLYLCKDGVYMDDGSGEVKISQSLEPWNYSFGCGVVHKDKYYLCAHRNSHGRELLVYDLQKKMWHREDDVYFKHLVSADERLYGAGWQDGGLWDLTGSRGTKEEAVNWSAVTGDLCQSSGEHQYISRVTLRLSLDVGSQLDIYARYDHNPLWVKLGTVYGTDPNSFSLPVRPRRCDHLQLKLEGQGPGKVYAITRTFEKGSEYR